MKGDRSTLEIKHLVAWSIMSNKKLMIVKHDRFHIQELRSWKNYCNPGIVTRNHKKLLPRLQFKSVILSIVIGKHNAHLSTMMSLIYSFDVR